MEHWTKGTFTEVVAPERLTIDHHVIDPCGGGPLFSAVTQVKFSAADGGTRIDVVQTYTVFDAAQVLRRIESMGDLFEPVLTLKQKLPKEV